MVGGVVGATRLGLNRIWDGEERVPDESRVGMDGSPLQGRYRTGDGGERLPDGSWAADGVGATRPGLNRTCNGEDGLPDESMEGMGGVLQQVERLPDELRDGVGRSPVRDRSRVGGVVGATRHGPDWACDDEDR